MTAMRICMVSEDYEPGVAGVSVHLQTLVTALVDRGHQVLVLTSRKPGQPKRTEAGSLTVHRFPAINLSGFHHSVTTTGAVRRLLEGYRPDVVHVHFLSRLAGQARRAAQRLGVRTIYTYHMAEEIITSPFAWLPPLQAFLTRRIMGFCNRFDCVTFPSQQLLDQARAKGLTANARFLGNAIALGRDRVPPSPRLPGPFVLLFVGRLSPEKNLAFLVRTFRAVVAAHPGAELWLAGNGPIRGALAALATELGIAPNVRFLGHVPNARLSDTYARADAFVLPSLFETQGMVCIEAMQFGNPLLVSDGIVSRDELVDQGENGFVFDRTSEGDLLRVVRILIENPGLRAAMASASLRKAETFSLDAVIAAHEALYLELLR
jgi:1,2-diacylglycerol 3-alpha-glucosyltransferase